MDRIEVMKAKKGDAGDVVVGLQDHILHTSRDVGRGSGQRNTNNTKDFPEVDGSQLPPKMH